MSSASAAPDVLVIGAGVFGAWTAYTMRRAGHSVMLIDSHGAGHTRSSSGSESRLIRMGYGNQEVYTRWSMRALDRWHDFFTEHRLPLFVNTGVLWMARADDALTEATVGTLQRLGVQFEPLGRVELERRFPQMTFGPSVRGVVEPHSGVLLARRAVQAVVREATRLGAAYEINHVVPPTGSGRLSSLRTTSGRRVSAGAFVFACGPWLPKMFPDLLGNRISPTRQEVFYFGCAAGDRRFAPPAMPAWVDFGEEIYGMPDFDGRGFKIAMDRHGPPSDPDTGDRIVSAEGLARVRRFLSGRFPDLTAAPLIESRVCHYANTSSGDFLIDRHPDFEDVWLVGGGSGHGFKHGPVVGEYAAERVLGGATLEPRFTLATKQVVQQRAVF